MLNSRFLLLLEQAIQLETTVKTLQQDLLDNEKAANSIQKELQRRLAEHESKVNELMTQLEEAQALTTQLEEAQDRLAALQNSSVGENNSSEKLRALETSLTETRELLHAERANQAKTESALEESQGKEHNAIASYQAKYSHTYIAFIYDRT